MGSFNSVPDTSTHNLQYNVTAFSASGLSNTQHTLVISANDYPNSTFINFDYAIYTYVYPVIALPAYCSEVKLGRMMESPVARPCRIHPLVELSAPVVRPCRIRDIHPLVPLVESLAPAAPHLQKLIMIHQVTSRGPSSDLCSESSRSLS